MTMQPPDKTDEELVKMYQTSLDKNIVGVLFKRHSLMCYGVSNKYLKDEDAAQDATMQIFEKLFSDLTKHEILNFRSWLHSVCRNYCLMELRKPMRVMRMRESEDDHENEFMELERRFSFFKFGGVGLFCDVGGFCRSRRHGIFRIIN